MKNYKITTHPLTGDLMWLCEYTPESISLVKKFIKEHYFEDYTLSIYDKVTANTLEILNPIEEIIDDITDIISLISSTEHTFVNFIGINSWSDSYSIGMDFTRGNIKIPSSCRYENGQFVSI